MDVGAFLEEMFFRGYLLNRANDLAGPGTVGTSIGVVVSALFFGLARGYQGVTGVAENVVTGAVLGVLYLVAGRNLWLPILTHGAVDTAGFLLIFSGLYP